MVIQHKYCWQKRGVTGGAWTYFDDGTSCFNHPPDHWFYRNVASWCGHTDLDQYNWEHEVTHAFLAEKMWDAPSPILWNAAHNRKGNIVGSKYEERWCYHFQRFLRGIASDVVEPEWHEWRVDARRRLQMTGEAGE